MKFSESASYFKRTAKLSYFGFLDNLIYFGVLNIYFSKNIFWDFIFWSSDIIGFRDLKFYYEISLHQKFDNVLGVLIYGSNIFLGYIL